MILRTKNLLWQLVLWHLWLILTILVTFRRRVWLLHVLTTYYPTGKNFNWILNLAISLMANPLNLNSTNYYIFRNLSMIVWIIENKNPNSLIFNSVNLTNLIQVAKFNSVHMITLFRLERCLFKILCKNHNHLITEDNHAPHYSLDASQ